MMNTSHNWVDTLRQRLEDPDLPGSQAHGQMSSIERKQRVAVADRSTARHSAVLMMLYEKEGEWHIPLIRRPHYDGVHGGQMALPGGKKEDQDASLQHTALRETHEEVGVILPESHVIGSLSELYIPPSNLLVTPYIALAPAPPTFTPDPREVAGIFEMPLSDFFNPNNRKEKSVTVLGKHRLKVPAFYIQEQTVWGATAMMINELIHLIEELELRENLRL